MIQDDQPRLHTDIMRDNAQEAERVVAEMQESIAARDWDAVQDLSCQLSELNDAISESAVAMIIGRDCAPHGV